MIHISPVVGPGDHAVGLPVLDADGRVVGTVSAAEAGALRVDVSADAPADTLQPLGWSAGDADRVLPAGLVAERTGEYVRLQA